MEPRKKKAEIRQYIPGFTSKVKTSVYSKYILSSVSLMKFLHSINSLISFP